jgi:hypothetical protein
VFFVQTAIVDAAEPSADKSGPEVVKGLSEFFAKVLNQLLLSSWLPAAAVVVGGVYVLALRQELDNPTQCEDGCSWATGLVGAAARLADLSVGGAVVLLILIIVATMLTQAFTFEAIRFLEGYWGANRIMRMCGKGGVAFHERRRRRLSDRQQKLRSQIADGTFRAIRNENSRRAELGAPPLLSAKMLEGLHAKLQVRKPGEALSEAEFQAVMAFPWEQYADPQLRLQKVVVENRLAVYPKEGWLMPTMLGNILRRHEQQMNVRNVESFVQDHFDELPPSLQRTHDEVKTRVDLYASLVFLLPLLGAFALAALLPDGWYVLGVEMALAALTLVAHRAALASARAYGSALVSVAGVVRATARG